MKLTMRHIEEIKVEKHGTNRNFYLSTMLTYHSHGDLHTIVMEIYIP